MTATAHYKNCAFFFEVGLFLYIGKGPSILRSDTRHKSRHSQVNVSLRHYGGQLKTALGQEEGDR